MVWETTACVRVENQNQCSLFCSLEKPTESHANEHCVCDSIFFFLQK